MKTLLFLLLITGSLHAKYLLLGPMVCHVDETSAKIWCSVDEKATVVLKLSEHADLKDSRMIKVENFEMGTIELDNLKEDTVYYYQLIANTYSKSPHCSFRTAKATEKPAKLRFMFSSCSGRTGQDGDQTWDDISRVMDLDLILMLGDNHYADTTDPDIISKHYFNHRAIGGFRKATSRIPTYGIWDDHDYGPNNSDGKTPGKEGSLDTFKKHWGNPAYGEKDNPGVYFTFKRGDIQFVMLDSRYHRTPNKSMKSNDPAKVLLGGKQFAWLARTLKQSTAKVKIVACGSEFQLHGSSDGFTGFKAEQKKILDIFEETDGVILISGDRHFTAGYQIRGKTLEVTSGPLGSNSSKPRQTPDMFFGEGPGKMFSVFEIDTTGSEPRVKLDVHKTGKGVIRTFSLNWDQVNGREKIKR